MLSPVDPEKSVWESMFSLRSTRLAFATIAQKLHTHPPAAVFTMRTPYTAALGGSALRSSRV